MANTNKRKAFQRRGFDVHITELMRQRREHGHSSFFDANGRVRDYAKAYLYDWLTPDLPGGPEAVPTLHIDALSQGCTLEDLKRYAEKPLHWDAAFRFLKTLHILDSEAVALFEDSNEDDWRDVQMDEYRKTYTVVENPHWEKNAEDDNIVYLR